MFCPRNQGRVDGSFYNILVEIGSRTDVDKDILPAALGCVLKDVLAQRRNDVSAIPNTAILSLAHHPRYFHDLANQCSVDPSNILDGFSEWYPVSREDGTGGGNLPHIVHMAALRPSSMETGSIAREICQSLTSSKSGSNTDVVIVIDSLSPLLRKWPSVASILDVQDLVMSHCCDGLSGSATLISTFYATEMHSRLHASLKRMANTLVVVDQYSGLESNLKNSQYPPDANRRDYIRFEVCKRKSSGRVQLDNFTAVMDWKDICFNNVESTDAGLKLERTPSRNSNGDRSHDEMLRKLGLSFRVSLSTKEKEVRTAAGLPYLHHDELLADSSLRLHPEELQLGNQPAHKASDAEDYEDDLSDYEDLFSEDV